MLRHGQLPPERYAYVFEVLERNAQSQALLIADVLDVSRIITGKLQLALEDVALVDVIGSALDGVRPAAASKGVQIRVEVEDGLALRADSQRLQQIVWNLASNAVKFTPPGGRVEVAARRHGNIVELTVSDTGIGIAPSFLPFVFDRFRQADQSTTRVHGGLGLGLAIVRHLTELHGGTVSVRSDGSDRGATFQVCLPALAKTAVASRAGMGPAETGTFKLSWPGIRILVVDDDPSTRELLAALLGGAGAEVTTAVSAREAQELLQEFPIDLLIADLGMPGKDGFALMSQIRASSETWRTVRAIALSAYADTRSKERALDAGFTRFVGKPVRPQDLLRTVNELVEAPA
jgi:CheY-like chemotaxis protein/two-component sensor histidine kinase